ncbi:hypothetical protein Tco_0247971 [Tanacetum coccineum]
MSLHMLVEYEHVSMDLTRLGLAAATIRNTCSFRIGLKNILEQRVFAAAITVLITGAISKQTTRISIITVNTVKYHSDILARSEG